MSKTKMQYWPPKAPTMQWFAVEEDGTATPVGPEIDRVYVGKVRADRKTKKAVDAAREEACKDLLDNGVTSIRLELHATAASGKLAMTVQFTHDDPEDDDGGDEPQPEEEKQAPKETKKKKKAKKKPEPKPDDGLTDKDKEAAAVLAGAGGEDDEEFSVKVERDGGDVIISWAEDGESISFFKEGANDAVFDYIVKKCNKLASVDDALAYMVKLNATKL